MESPEDETAVAATLRIVLQILSKCDISAFLSTVSSDLAVSLSLSFGSFFSVYVAKLTDGVKSGEVSDDTLRERFDDLLATEDMRVISVVSAVRFATRQMFTTTEIQK